MNHTLYIIIGVLLFALASATLYTMGLRKRARQNDNLTEMLLNNAALRVVNYLKKEHDTITPKGIGALITDVKAKEFHSRKTAVIADGKQFQDQLIDYMLRRNYITEDKDKKGRTVYHLPKKGGK